MTIGIYKLNFVGTDKVYIGQSRRVEKRLSEHLTLFYAGNHTRKMQEAYDKYGAPTLELLCECTLEELNDFENETIEIWDAVDNGFNSAYRAGEYAPLPGELNGSSKYSNDKIIEVFKYLVSTNLTADQISSRTSVSSSVVSNISSGKSHSWLKEVYPVEYTKLILLIGTRNKGINSGSTIYKKDEILQVLNILVNNPSMTLIEVSERTSISLPVIQSISKGDRHKWLANEYPLEYAKLLMLKGTRNSAINRGIKYPPIVDPSGTIYTVTNAREFSRNHNLNQSALGRVLNGTAKMHKGWTLAITKE